MKKELIKELESLEQQAYSYGKQIETYKKQVEELAQKNYSLSTYLCMLKDYAKDIGAYQQYLFRIREKAEMLSRIAIAIKDEDFYNRIDKLVGYITKYI